MQFSYKPSLNRRLDFRSELKFGQPGFAFQYSFPTIAADRFLSCKTSGYVVGRQSENALHLCFSVSRQILFYRITDLTTSGDDNQFLSFSTLMDGLA